MEWTKFLCVASNFDCFLTNINGFFDCFSTKNRSEHALRLSLCPERGLFKGLFDWWRGHTKTNCILISMSYGEMSTHDARESMYTVSQFSLGITCVEKANLIIDTLE